MALALIVGLRSFGRGTHERLRRWVSTIQFLQGSSTFICSRDRAHVGFNFIIGTLGGGALLFSPRTGSWRLR